MVNSAQTRSTSSIGTIGILLKINLFKVSWKSQTNLTRLGIPLSGRGFFYFITFNSLCLMAYITHLRAAFSDPGKIP
jgi:hypothetical protein